MNAVPFSVAQLIQVEHAGIAVAVIG